MALDRNNLDTSIHPGQDFYQYANGGWMKDNPLPGEFSRYGSFDKLAEENQKLVKELIENAASDLAEEGSIPGKVGDFFAAGMDTVSIETLGISPIQPDIELLEKAESMEDIRNIITSWHGSGSGVLFSFFGSADKKNSEMVIANIYQGGLGLTDVDYYTEQDPKSKSIRERYLSYIKDMLMLSGEKEALATSSANKILAFETRLAKASMTRLERRNPHATYNKMRLADLSELSPAFNWNSYFDGIGMGDPGELNVAQPEFFKAISHMIADVPPETWKVYLKFHLINDAASFLSSEFVNTNFGFYGKFLSGRQVIQPRWKRVVRVEDYALGEAIGQMFVEKYFPPEAKERMVSLVGNLRYALAERIKALDWMSDSTKIQALAKLEKMNVKIGYPDKWRDYSGLEVTADSYYENVKKANQFNFEYMLSKINKPVDPDEWGMTPQTVNAYYSPSRNEIVFPAGILQPPFFYMDADEAVNYGAIGVVIGHEMTHGFDDQGRQYDKDGNLRDWWTAKDAEKFNERTKVLVEQFNQFSVLDTIKANGALTLGENIADLGGLNVAYTAMLKSWKDNPESAQTINGFTPEQRFFLAYAHVWAQNITDQEILRRTREDVHSLGRFRVNGPLPHLEEFYAAFGLDANAGMYIPVEERAVIW